MAQCPTCGTATTSADQAFCLVCGAALDGAKAESATRVPPPPAPAAARPEVAGGSSRRAAQLGPGAVVPFGLGLLGAVVLELLVNTIVPETAYFHRLFRPQGGWYMSVVPALTIFAFFWTCADLYFKFRVARISRRYTSIT